MRETNRPVGGIPYYKILPVLFLEYLAIGIARTLFPGMIVDAFGKHSYFAIGIMETLKGLLAFVASPLFGRLSDIIGRKYCLLATVIGTTAPVCMMAFTSNMYLYSIAMSVSGFFSATFALTFAYISDCVEDKRNRAPAYGMALATFGAAFTFGPVTGSYLAQEFSPRFVFMSSSVLVVLDIIYVVLFLPESVKVISEDKGSVQQKFSTAVQFLPNSWNFRETFRVFSADSFMSHLAWIVFVYYISVWSLVSTLLVYITRQLNFTTVELGWLMTGYGLSTVFSEAILVRIIVPRIGENNSIRLGLLSFAAQCVVVGISTNSQWIFISVGFSMLANLVYPSISSLVSKVVDENIQGEALGALNGIKALTEGFGPLFFGLLMALFENTPDPGAPYILCALLAFWAFLHCYELPSEPEDAMVEFKKDRRRRRHHRNHNTEADRLLLSAEDLLNDDGDDEDDTPDFDFDAIYSDDESIDSFRL